MCLSHLLKRSGINHTLLHCNFQLRGKESDEDELFVRSYAQKNGLPVECKRFETEDYAGKHGLNTQLAARELRYAWFNEFLHHGDSYLLTAHHLDDSIETFFINLLRGTGIKGLGGIPVTRDNIIRPLSEFTSEDIYKYISDNQLEYRQDSSNNTDKYLRNKIRHHVIPEILDIAPAFKEKMEDFFTEMKSIQKFLKKEADTFREQHFSKSAVSIRVPLAELKKMNSTSFLQYLFEPYGLTKSGTAELTNLLQGPSGKKLIVNDYIFLVDRDKLLIYKECDSQFVREVISTPEFNYNDARTSIEIRASHDTSLTGSESIQKLDLEKIEFPLTLRNWSEGDKVQPLGMKGKKLISDVLIDKKVDQQRKGRVLVLEDAKSTILCLPGLLVSDNAKLDDSSKDVMEIHYLEQD